MKSEIISQGAEATITLSGKNITKNRIPKSYRLKELDEKIRKSRTKKEAKLLEKALEFTSVPKIIKQDKFSLEIEHIKGDKLSEKLNSYKKEKQSFVMQEVGKSLAKLHEIDIIHGDLTTSNMILSSSRSKQKSKQFSQSENKSSQEEAYIIDFGLGYISKRIEDKAVDLHLIKQALEAKHFQNWEFLFKELEKGYKKDYKEADKILEQLKKVESRGRYKKGS